MKKQGFLLLALLLVFSLVRPLPARGELKIWEEENSTATAFYRFSTWGSELPQVLGDVLAREGYGDLASFAGAMCEIVEKQSQVTQSIRALVALKGDAGPIALGMAYNRKDRQWYLDDMGAKAFLPGQDFTLQVLVSEEPSRPFYFAMDYAGPGGGTIRYEFDDGHAPQRPWVLRGYGSWDSRGRGLAITSLLMEQGYRVRQLPAEDGDRGVFYPGFVCLIVRYMPGGVSDYPTTQEDARRIAQESLPLFEGKDLAIVYGAHLREQPTGHSKSLGVAQPGALAQVLGQKKGREYPWFHLRLGDVEGYMSGNYVNLLPEVEVFLADPFSTRGLGTMPPPLAQANAACVLRQSPTDGAKEVSRLPAGTRMHVLSVTGNGFYQVMVPRGEPDWIMDVEGTSGYVKGEEVKVVSGMVIQ